MRPLLVGMVNPLSSDPRHALYPHPRGSAGERLYRIFEDATGASRTEYLSAFHRVNLLPSAYAACWDSAAAHEAAVVLRLGIGGRTVVLLGDAVRRAFRVPRGEVGVAQTIALAREPVEPTWDTATVYCLPHPSGRCLWYNDPENRVRAGELLRRLYEESRA